MRKKNKLKTIKRAKQENVFIFTKNKMLQR
jgi:hypothetical protein